MLMYNLKLKLFVGDSVAPNGVTEICTLDFGNFVSYAKCKKFFSKVVDSATITLPDGSAALRSCVITLK